MSGFSARLEYPLIATFTKLAEAEMANATLEAEIREEASAEMAQHLQRLEAMYTKRLQEQVSVSSLVNAVIY